MDNLKEIFALPIGLREVVKYNGIPLYGSDTLNEKFIHSMNTNKRTKDIGKTIEKMVKDKVILPCFADPGLLTYFRRKISRNTSGGLMRVLKLLVFAPNPITDPLDYVLRCNSLIFLLFNSFQDQFSCPQPIGQTHGG